MESETKKVLTLVIVVIVLVVIAIAFVFSRLLGGGDSSERPQPTEFPADAPYAPEEHQVIDDEPVSNASSTLTTDPEVESPTSSESVISLPANSWQDEVVVFSTNNDQSYDQPVVPAAEPVNDTPVGLVPTLIIENPVLTPPVSSAESGYEAETTPGYVHQAFAPLDLTTDIKSCGRLKRFADEYGTTRSIADLATEKGVECLGQAVADGCINSSLTVPFSDGLETPIYVLEQPDGSCGINISETDNKINLCNIKNALNSRLPETEQKTLVEWQEEFAEKPGETMTTAYTNIMLETEAEYIEAIDCRWYTM
jgi:hypothetical protein